MKRKITYTIALASLLLVSCNKALEKSEIEDGFAPLGDLPTVSIDASAIEVDQYAQTVTLDVTFSGVASGMENLELGLLSATDPGFVESNVTLVDTPADGTYRLTVQVSAGNTNYIKAMAACTNGGAVYSDRITVDVPDIPWYYKIADEYIGTYGPDENTASNGATPYENHVVTVEVAEDFSTLTLYDIDPYLENETNGYVSRQMNYVTGTIDLEARTVTFTVSGQGVDPHLSPYLLSPISGYSSDGYSLAKEFVLQFNEDATELHFPWYAVLNQQESTLSYVYAEDGVTLTAN